MKRQIFHDATLYLKGNQIPGVFMREIRTIEKKFMSRRVEEGSRWSALCVDSYTRLTHRRWEYDKRLIDDSSLAEWRVSSNIL